MTNEGYIKLYRKMTKWGWYKDNNTKCVFLHLLFMACYEPYYTAGKYLQPGQIVTTVREISEQTGISVQSVRTSLERLKSTNEITIFSTPKNSLITVNNYSDYQDADKLSNKQLTNSQQTANKPTYIKEGKEGKEGKERIELLYDSDLSFNGGKVENSEPAKPKRNTVPQYDVDWHFKRITERYGKETTKEELRELMETLPNIDVVYEHFGIEED